jgi:hypothetical protein
VFGLGERWWARLSFCPDWWKACLLGDGYATELFIIKRRPSCGNAHSLTQFSLPLSTALGHWLFSKQSSAFCCVLGPSNCQGREAGDGRSVYFNVNQVKTQKSTWMGQCLINSAALVSTATVFVKSSRAIILWSFSSMKFWEVNVGVKTFVTVAVWLTFVSLSKKGFQSTKVQRFHKWKICRGCLATCTFLALKMIGKSWQKVFKVIKLAWQIFKIFSAYPMQSSILVLLVDYLSFMIVSVLELKKKTMKATVE